MANEEGAAIKIAIQRALFAARFVSKTHVDTHKIERDEVQSGIWRRLRFLLAAAASASPKGRLATNRRIRSRPSVGLSIGTR